MNKAGAPTRRDALWTVGTTAIGAVLQIVQLMVATRYLEPRAFGALAIVNIVVWLVLAFQDMGLSSYCIHLGEAPRSAHSTLFWISAGFGVVGALIVVGLAYPLAQFYAIPDLTLLLPLLSLNFVLLGLGSQYQANLVRTFQARRLAKLELAARCFGFVVTVALLVSHTAGVSAVVFGLIAFAAAKLIFMGFSAQAHWHPTLQFDKVLAPAAIKYGAYQASSQVINQLRTQADQLILGKALGPESLGLYSLAKELISYPLRFLQPLFSRLTLPALAHNQHNPSALRATYLRAMQRTALICAIVYGGLAITAPWVVEIMFGPKFLPVTPLIPLLAVFGMLRPMGLNAGMLAQATGRTSNEFRWNVIAALVTLPATALVGIFWPTLYGFAVAAAILQMVILVLSYPYFIKPLEPVGLAPYIRSWAAPFAATLAAVGVALLAPVPSLSALGLAPHLLAARFLAIFHSLF